MTVEAPEKVDLANLLARLDDLRHLERRAASARMVSVAGHLVGTPLNVIAGRAALIRSSTTPESINENVRRIEEQVERLAHRIRRLIDYFGLAPAPLNQQKVTDILNECSALYAPIAELRGVTLQVEAQGVDTFSVDGSLASLVLTALLSLGLRSSKPGQAISVTATEPGPQTVQFELQLPGLEPPPKSFERLEPPEHGLSYDAGALETFWICLGLVRRSGGALEVVPATSGAGVTIRLQCAHG